MRLSLQLAVTSVVLAASALVAQKSQRAAPPVTKTTTAFRDSRFGVRFRIPPGWDFSRKDGQVSTFRLDARTARAGTQMRAVAGLDDNPFPLSTLSGAVFYYSVQPHSTDIDCERQATGEPAPSTQTRVDLQSRGQNPAPVRDLQNIGGMNFTHGHDEHGGICVEARDEIYTAFRKGSCYRFDLQVNTFCSITSGALEMSASQMREIEERMTSILSTVSFDWEKSGAHLVPVPAPPTPIEPPHPVVTEPAAAADSTPRTAVTR